MMDLAKVFQFVDDGFNQGTTTQDGFFEVGTGHRFHVFLEFRDELDALIGQILGEPSSDVALIGKQLSEQAFTEIRNRLPVIDIAGGELDTKQFSPGIDDEMELEAEEPSCRRFATLGVACKGFMA